MTRAIVIGPRKWKKKLTYDPSLEPAIDVWLINKLRDLNESGNLEVCSSLHLGIDTKLAEFAVNMNIPLTVILASPDQHILWDERNRENFKLVLKRASRIDFISQGYEPGCIKSQIETINNWVSENEDGVILLLSLGKKTNSMKERIQQLKKKNRIIEWKLPLSEKRR